MASDDEWDDPTGAVAPAWNEFPDDSEIEYPATYGPEEPLFRGQHEMPATDSRSKTAMLQAQRRDTITITTVVERYNEEPIPNYAEVVKRAATYYGPNLTLHAEADGVERNYMLTAPGPDAHLLLWADVAETDEDGRRWRSGWQPAAEVKAEVHEVGKLSLCDVCYQPMETIQHERESAFGICSRGDGHVE
jgi:hypothetical protein